MSETTVPLEIVQYPDEGDPVVVGKAELLADGQLRLTAARDSHLKQLGHAVADINGKEGLHVLVAPEEGSPRYANASRLVPRGNDGDYLAALQDYFRKYLKLEVEDVREV